MHVEPTLRQQIMSQAQGTLSLSLAYIGITNHLFAALAADGPATAAALASRAGVDAAYVQRWADAASAFGHLVRDGQTFSLSEQGRAFLPDALGTLMPFAIQAVLSAHMAERAAALMPSGDCPGEVVLAERTTVLPWFGPMLESTFAPIFADTVLPLVPVLSEVGQRGGLAVDLGCGNGWYLRRMATVFPKLRGVGMDMVPANIQGAIAAADRDGLSPRLDFRLGDLHHFAVDQPADLVIMNRALHHVWGQGAAQVMGRLASHLAPGGAVAIWEPRWPDDPAGMAASPKLRGMAFQNLAEHVQGNHFLRPDQVEDALRGAGLRPESHIFAEGTEMVIVGRKAG